MARSTPRPEARTIGELTTLERLRAPRCIKSAMSQVLNFFCGGSVGKVGDCFQSQAAEYLAKGFDSFS